MSDWKANGPQPVPQHVGKAIEGLTTELWAVFMKHWLANDVDDRLAVALGGISSLGGAFLGRLFCGHEQAVTDSIEAISLDMRACADQARNAFVAELAALNLVN